MTAPVINMQGDMLPPPEVRQEDTMRAMRFRDQHGRSWQTVISKKTLEPCTMMTPEGWRSPLPMMTPPQKYFRFDPNEMGRTWIDYDRWMVDISNAEREYMTHVWEVAKREFGAAAAQKVESRDIGLRALCGPPPQSVEYIKAMKAGNKWALGIPRPDGTPYPRPAWADPYYDSWIFESTFDGGTIDFDIDPSAYPDEDEDTAEIAARIAAAEEYADLEEDADPDAQPDFEPIRRASKSRKRTE